MKTKLIIDNRTDISYGGILAILKFFGKLKPWFDPDYDNDYPTEKELAYGYVDGELISAQSVQTKTDISISILPASKEQYEKDKDKLTDIE